jgi:hypothetical protein
MSLYQQSDLFVRQCAPLENSECMTEWTYEGDVVCQHSMIFDARQ